jgi:acetyltransferase-like isoleucine patch superfamily enzyme
MRRIRRRVEILLLRQTAGLFSRFRMLFYRSLGMKIGDRCRMESIRVRRPAQIEVGKLNSLTRGCWLWPEDGEHSGIRIRIGDANYFNRDVMIDSCNRVEIGSHNMFGPGVYITDSNHTLPPGVWVGAAPMERGKVCIGNGCWIGAKAVILKDVILGDRCVVGAGAVVTRSFAAGSVIAGVPARLIRTQPADRGFEE